MRDLIDINNELYGLVDDFDNHTPYDMRSKMESLYDELHDIEEYNTKLNTAMEVVIETIKNNSQELLWEYCDCGCPSKSTAKSKEAIEVIKVLKFYDAIVNGDD